MRCSWSTFSLILSILCMKSISDVSETGFVFIIRWWRQGIRLITWKDFSLFPNPFDSIMSSFSPFHAFANYSVKIRFNVVLMSTPQIAPSFEVLLLPKLRTNFIFLVCLAIDFSPPKKCGWRVQIANFVLIFPCNFEKTYKVINL